MGSGKSGRSWRRDIPWAILVLAYVVYAGLFIYRTSFVVEGQRHFTLFDDAMISMRYAKNLAHGDGLVWNPGGERVEGFSNPLWVLIMAGAHLLPIPPMKISLLIQLGGALLFILALFVIRGIAESFTGKDSPVALCTAIMTAFYLPLNNWVLQGMEVSLLVLLTCLAVSLGLRLIRTDTFSPWLYLMLGVGTLVRMDMVVPYLATLTFLAWHSPRHRRRHLGWGLLTLAVFVVGQEAARLCYYHQWLPNTYYLKMTGFPLLLRLSRGVSVLFKFIFHLNWILFLLPLTILLFRRGREVLFLFWIFLGQIAYSVWVGGDAWEWWGGSNRYISIVMPVFFITFSLAAEQIGLWLESASDGWPRRLRSAVVRGWPVFFLLSMVNFNMISDNSMLKNWLLIDRPLWVDGNRDMVQQALLLKRVTTPQASIAVTWAGAIPYFANRTAIDILGKNDLVIAREPAKYMPRVPTLTYFVPGHVKWDYAHSFGTLKPDVVVQMWWKPHEAEEYLDADYEKVRFRSFHWFVRKGSPHVRWDVLENLRWRPKPHQVLWY